MDIRNPFTLLRDITKKSPTVPAEILDKGELSQKEKDLIRRVGITFSQLQMDINADVNVTWDRQRYTTQLNRSLDHALIAAAMRLYSSSATNMSPIHNSSVWVTSKSPKYQKVLSNLLDDIGIEEKIYDWAWTVAAFGDLFIEINGLPNLGIVSINDDRNPIEISRIEHNGILVGFYETPMGHTSSAEKSIIEPWKYVHLRLLGSKRNRPNWGDPSYSEFKTMSLMMGNNTRQATSRYGASLILDALPTYKRLRMAEDSLLLARMTRGILRYVYTLKVDSTNAEMLESLIDQIANTLKRARSINTSDSNPNFQSRECLRGNTKVSLCDGTSSTIQEITENKEKYVGKYVWTINEKTQHIESKRILSAQKTRRNAQLVRVHLDNGEYVDCTPDHPVMLREGTFKQAQYLLPNESLMPFYTKVTEKGLPGYSCVYDPGDNKYHFMHRLISGFLPKGFCVHHLDFNKQNNDPANLYICSNEMHRKVFHGNHLPETIEKIKENQVAWLKGRNVKEEPELQYLYENSPFYNYNLRTEESKKESVRKQIETKKRNGTLNCTPKGEDHPNYGKTWKELLGESAAAERKKKQSKRMSGENNPAKRFEVRKKISENKKGRPYVSKKQKAQLMECLLNHKVTGVEWLDEREDTYDLTIDGNHNFSLACGVFVHNSPMGVTEDLFLPLPDVNDLAIDEIGGSPDIRWIVDVDELKQQLACALSTPLSLLGGYVDEATGALGSEAIEKLDIGFARNSRRLQRALINGIKRICQIHLAYQNMDPDPSMFEVNMCNPSTAEEKSLQETLETGTNVISMFMEMIEEIDPEIDKPEVFNYLNQKILKLEDFDLSNFKKTTIPLGEKEDKGVFKRYPIKDTDLITFLPLSSKKVIVEGKERDTIKATLSERSAALFHKRWENNWVEQYGSAVITEGVVENKKQLKLEDEATRKRREGLEEELYNPV